MKRSVLVTVANDAYMPYAQQLFSCLYYYAGWQDDCVVLTNDLSPENQHWFQERGIGVEILPPFSNALQDNWTKRTRCLKLHVFGSRFRAWDQVVFIDADTIVRHSLESLTSVTRFSAVAHGEDLANQFVDFAAVAKRWGRNIDGTTKVLNSGVFAFPTASIPSDAAVALAQLCEDYIPLCRFADQPILNLYFYKQWQRLPILYNVPLLDFKSYYAQQSLMPGPHILHFLGTRGKKFLQQSPYLQEWERNLQLAGGIHMHEAREQKKTTPWQNVIANLHVQFHDKFLYTLRRKMYWNRKKIVRYWGNIASLFSNQ